MVYAFCESRAGELVRALLGFWCSSLVSGAVGVVTDAAGDVDVTLNSKNFLIILGSMYTYTVTCLTLM